MTQPQGTIAHRLSSYDRWQKYSTYFGAGLGGLILVAGLTPESMQVWPKGTFIFVTLVIVSATLLGRSYIGYTKASNRLKVYWEGAGQSIDGVTPKQSTTNVPSDAEYKYPNDAYWSCLLGLLGSGLAALLLIIGSWRVAPVDSQPSIPSVTVTQTITQTATTTLVDTLAPTTSPTT